MRPLPVPSRLRGLVAAGLVGLALVAAPGTALAEDEPAASSGAVSPAPDPGAGETGPGADAAPEVLAAVPAAPSLDDLDGRPGSLYLALVDTSSGADAATSFQGSTDGTTWVDLTDVWSDGYYTYGTFPGLTDGTTYPAVRVRAVNASGPSAASNTLSGTPYVPIGAPATISVVRSGTQVSVGWGDPAAPGTFPIAGFVVVQDADDRGDTVCEVDLAARSCRFELLDGRDNLVRVFAVDDRGAIGVPVEQRTGAIGAPASPGSLPTRDDGDITGPGGALSVITAGRDLAVQGAGFMYGSTVRITAFSAPVELGTAVVDYDGSFTTTVTVPATLTDGTHHLVATGFAPDGSIRNLVITVTVSGGVATLATTGFDAVPVAVGGALVLLAGGGLLLGARRRSTL